MKAWVLDEPSEVTAGGPLRLRDVERPTPERGEILVRVSVCGLCRTDLHVIQGEIDLPKLPVVPGHQVVGRVVGSSRRFEEGQRVGVAWLHETCGSCADCFRGDENLCRNARYTGYHVDGGYAEYVKVPEDFAYALPDGLSDEQIAPLLCAGIIGYRALRQADLEEGENVGLYGFGSSAHIALQVARHMGCRVFVVTRGERHRELAREMGAIWVGAEDDTPPEPLDRAVIFAPAGEVVPKALGAVRWGGTVSSAAIHMSPIPTLDYDTLLFGERTLRSTTANTREDGRELLEIAAEGGIRTHVTPFAMEDVHEGLLAILEDRVQGSAVLRVTADAPPRR
jgi:propanol-preferring alcohol dehydrogenase